MKKTTPKTKTSEIYNFYINNTNKPVNKTLFNNINWELNQYVINYLLLGENRKFDFGSRLGYLSIFKFHRKLKIRDNKLVAAPDWGTTKKLKAEGKLNPGKIVYFTDNYFIGFKWIKEHCNIKGNHAYMFKASRTNGVESTSGAKTQLAQKLKDPLYHFKFSYIEEI